MFLTSHSSQFGGCRLLSMQKCITLDAGIGEKKDHKEVTSEKCLENMGRVSCIEKTAVYLLCTSVGRRGCSFV